MPSYPAEVGTGLFFVNSHLWADYSVQKFIDQLMVCSSCEIANLTQDKGTLFARCKQIEDLWEKTLPLPRVKMLRASELDTLFEKSATSEWLQCTGLR